jgi:hypothetical protein
VLKNGEISNFGVDSIGVTQCECGNPGSAHSKRVADDFRLVGLRDRKVLLGITGRI